MAAAYDRDGNRVFQLNYNLHTDDDWKGMIMNKSMSSFLYLGRTILRRSKKSILHIMSAE